MERTYNYGFNYPACNVI